MIFIFSLISEMIEKAKPYDTIFIEYGIYKESIIIRKPLTLIGKNYPIIDGENKREIILVESDDVSIIGFEIINSGFSEIYETSAIKVINSKNCKILNNKLKNNFFGIYLENVNKCEIKNNEIENEIFKTEALMGNGIHIWKSKNLLIENNIIYGHRDGIYLEFVDSSIIKNNKSYYNLRYGLHFMFSKEIILESCSFKSNKGGTALMYSSNLTIKNNKFTQNYGASNYGLLLKEIKDSYFEKNEFYENTNGIYLENSINNNFYSNIFKRNKFAIRIMANCENNYFKGNFFIDNLFEVLTNSITTFNNKFLRNYWDKYIGYDRNKDNIGDEPYRIMKMSSFLFENYKISIILLNSPLLSFLEFIEKLIPSISLNIYDYEPILKYGHS